MSRGLIPGLRNPNPFLGTLPAIYQERTDAPAPPASNGSTTRARFPTGAFTVTVAPTAPAIDDGARARTVDLTGDGVWTIMVERADERAQKATDRFDVSFYRNGERVGTGIFLVSGDRLEVVTSRDGRDPGTYRWTFTGSSLLLDAIEDPSETRRALLSARPLDLEGFTQRFLSAFDEILAPIVSVIDNVHAYFDPMLAPEDFLEWIASWFSVSPPKDWPLRRRRERIRSAVSLFRSWGTAQGIRDYIAAITGIAIDRIEVIETGGLIVSDSPGAPFPGEAEPRVIVRLMVPDPQTVDVDLITDAVAAAKPAHVLHEVEVVPK